MGFLALSVSLTRSSYYLTEQIFAFDSRGGGVLGGGVSERERERMRGSLGWLFELVIFGVTLGSRVYWILLAIL